MRITKLYIQNFRSIENLSLDFPHFYTAICGKNDAGKSNVIRVLRLLFKTTESPYCLALGMSSREIEPWKSVLFANRDKVVLVEGSIDREYINLLRRDVHGTNRFCFDGEIFPYEGKDSLKQKQLLRFVKSQFKRFIVTYDLDAEKDVEPSLKDLGLVKGKDYIAIGRDSPGKRCIEGLLPDAVLQAVYGANVELVQKATSNDPQAKSAKNQLKQLLLAEFQKQAEANTDGYKAFYALGKQLTKMLDT